MSKEKPTFGRTLVILRQRQGLNQKDLAQKVRRENGSPISASYLNDIEHDRRNPSSEHLIKQFASALDADASYLTYVAGQLPSEIRDLPIDQDKFSVALAAFCNAAEEK